MFQRWYLLSAFILTAAAWIPQAKAEFEVYGFAQVDYIQDFKRVNPNWQDTLRPSRIPATDGEFGSDGQATISPKQSRLGARSSTPLEGKTLETKFEFDFFGVGVDEGQTTPRFRHAYGQWGDWLGGLTNSLFMDGDIFPNVIDYWGPAGMVFLRTAQLRWMPMQGDMSLYFAIEKANDDIDYGMLRVLDPNISNTVKSDEKLPDLTAQWRTKGAWGHFQVAGILRDLGFENIATADHEPKKHTTGWGVDVSTGIKLLASDRLLLSVVSGEGIANYMNDGGTDFSVEGTVAAPVGKAVPLTGYMAYYDHSWNEKWTSSIGFSQTEVKNLELQTDTAFKRGQYASVNILSTPQKNVMYGAEYLWGSRQNKDGTNHDDSRIQISMKYSFSSKE